jgi:hypothetical protein
MRGNMLGGYSIFDAQTAIKCSDVLVLSDHPTRDNLAAPVGKATQLFALDLWGRSLCDHWVA